MPIYTIEEVRNWPVGTTVHFTTESMPVNTASSYDMVKLVESPPYDGGAASIYAAVWGAVGHPLYVANVPTWSDYLIEIYSSDGNGYYNQLITFPSQLIERLDAYADHKS